MRSSCGILSVIVVGMFRLLIIYVRMHACMHVRIIRLIVASLEVPNSYDVSTVSCWLV